MHFKQIQLRMHSELRVRDIFQEDFLHLQVPLNKVTRETHHIWKGEIRPLMSVAKSIFIDVKTKQLKTKLKMDVGADKKTAKDETQNKDNPQWSVGPVCVPINLT